MTEKTLIENNIDYYLSLLSDWEKRLILSVSPNEKALAELEINKLKKHVQELKIELNKIENDKNILSTDLKSSSNFISYIIIISSVILGFWLIKYWGVSLISFAIGVLLIELDIIKNSLFLKPLFFIATIVNVIFVFIYTNYYQTLIFLSENFKEDNIFGKDDISKSPPLIDSQTLLLLISVVLLISCTIALLKHYKK